MVSSDHLELLVTYGNLEEEGDMFQTVKNHFLVLPCKSPFQCIVGRPTLGRLEAVTSTLYLKMKFYNLWGKVVTGAADIGATRQSHHLARKIDRQAPNALQPREQPQVRVEVNVADLDAWHEPVPREKEEASTVSKELRKRMKRLEPYGEFTSVPLTEDETKTIKIGSDLPEEVKQSLIKCLQKNADLFAWSAADMPEIPMEVVCHHLPVNPETKWVSTEEKSPNG